MTDDRFYDRARTEIAINLLAPVHLTHLFTALSGLETIINVTSGLAFVPLTRVPVYSATKAFMRSFTLSLRQQLSPRAIEVIEVIPPALHTDLGGAGKHDGQPEVKAHLRLQPGTSGGEPTGDRGGLWADEWGLGYEGLRD